MSAVPVESLDAAVRRIFGRELREGYTLTAAHEYAQANGEPWNWRIRLDHPSKSKIVRPFKFTGSAYQLGEPPKPAEGKPLYRLPDIAANPDAPVWVVEGERCADALAALGLVATTSGSSSSADAADWRPLAGRSAVLWPDNDTAGRDYAEAVKRALGAIGCAVEVLDVAQLGLPDAGDAVDWLAGQPTATAEAVSSLPRRAAAAPAVRGRRAAPEPLERAMLEPEEYPTAALGKILGPAAVEIQRATQAPAGIIGPALLSAASLAVQGYANVENDGRSDPLSLWFVTVALSGERKSAVDDLALREHKAVQREGRDAYLDAMAEHRIELAAHKAESGRALASKDPDLKGALTKLGPEPEPPLAPWMLVSEPTLEGLHKLLATGRPSVGIFTSDAGEFLGGHAMNKENKGKTAAGLSLLWDHGEFNRVRSGDGASVFYGRRVAMHLMVQPFLADGVFSDTLLVTQGFLPRCLVAQPKSTIGKRMYARVDAAASDALRRYWSVMGGLLRGQMRMREGTRNELDPRALTMTPEAKAKWESFHDAIELEMGTAADGKPGDYAGITGWGSKAPANVSRIAGVLSLVDDPNTGVIGLEHIERAGRLVEWHLRETLRIIRAVSDPPEVRAAKALLKWLQETGRKYCYSTDAMNAGPACVRDVQSYNAAVAVLLATDWLEPVPEGTVIDGRQRKRAMAVRGEEG